MSARKFLFPGAVASVSFLLVASLPAGAQSGAGTSKTVFENNKVVVTDNVLKPGDASPSSVRGGRVLYYITGGTLERTFADGTKESVTRKTGQAVMNSETRPYAVTNTGKTTVRVITVMVK
jgi:hypothetical protein